MPLRQSETLEFLRVFVEERVVWEGRESLPGRLTRDGLVAQWDAMGLTHSVRDHASWTLSYKPGENVACVLWSQSSDARMDEIRVPTEREADARRKEYAEALTDPAYTATQAEVARRPDRCCDLCVASAEGGVLDPTAIKTATAIVDDADGVPTHLCDACAETFTPPSQP